MGKMPEAQNFLIPPRIWSSGYAFISGSMTDPALRGVVPRSLEQIFQHIQCSVNQQYLVRLSYVQVYQVRDFKLENIYDFFFFFKFWKFRNVTVKIC